jgi:hypothetical protein
MMWLTMIGISRRQSRNHDTKVVPKPNLPLPSENLPRENRREAVRIVEADPNEAAMNADEMSRGEMSRGVATRAERSRVAPKAVLVSPGQREQANRVLRNRVQKILVARGQANHDVATVPSGKALPTV